MNAMSPQSAVSRLGAAVSPRPAERGRTVSARPGDGGHSRPAVAQGGRRTPAGASPGATGSEPRWLTDDEQRVWRLFLAVNRLLWARLEQELQRDAGMPHAYYEVLVHLSEAPGRRLRMSQLAERSLSSPSRLSHAVNRLERLGWVVREALPADRRCQIAVLTDAGFAALAAAAPGHVEGVRTHLFDALTPEQVRQLGDICQAIVQRINAVPCRQCAPRTRPRTGTVPDS